MFLVSCCSCLCAVYWSQVLSRKWRCSWSSAGRRCSNYIGVINNFIAYWGVPYVRGLTVYPLVMIVCWIWPLTTQQCGFLISNNPPISCFSRHYKQAYGHVLDLRMHDTNLLEIKTIAGFVNYKVRWCSWYIFWHISGIFLCYWIWQAYKTTNTF